MIAAVLAAQRIADGGHGAKSEFIAEPAGRVARRRNDDECGVGGAHHRGSVVRRSQASAAGIDQVLKPGLIDGGSSGVDRSHSFRVYIGCDNGQALAGQNGRERRSELAKTDDANSHASPFTDRGGAACAGTTPAQATPEVICSKARNSVARGAGWRCVPKSQAV